MRLRTTWILIGVAGAMFLYIMLVERAPESGRTAKPALLLWPDLDPRNVTSIEVERANLDLRVERVQGRWQINAPLYPGDGLRIDRFLQVTADLKKTGYIEPREILSEPGGLTPFGLNPPQATVTLAVGTNRYRFMLGNKTPLRGEVYLEEVGAAGVFITESAILDLVPEKASDWRDRRLVLLKEPFDRLQVQAGTSGFELERQTNGEAWRFDKPMPARADARRVQEFLQAFQVAEIHSFVSDDPGADLDGFGLNLPLARLTYFRGTNLLLSIDFGRSPTNKLVYAHLSAHTNVVLVSKELLELLRYPHTFFRDRVLLSFSPDKVDRIEVRAAQTFSVTRQTNGLWWVEPFRYPADPQLVRGFLNNLAQLRVVDYVKDVVTDFSSYSLAPPAREYVLESKIATPTGSTNEIVGQVGFSPNQMDEAFARRTDENSVYAISAGDLIQLPTQAFQLRDRAIFQFAPQEVVSIVVHQHGQTRQLRREASGGWGLGDIANAALEETLYRLGRLRAIDWVGQGEREYRLFGFPAIDYRVEIHLSRGTQSQTLILHFGKAAARQGNVYAAVTLPGQKEPTIFVFPGRLFADVTRDLGIPATASAF